MTNPLSRVIAVIPAHDEGRTIADVVARTRPHVAEVVVVDDGSHDDTARLAAEAGAHVETLRPNRGKGGALAHGLDVAAEHGATAVVTLDADGEHEPEDIPELLKALEKADVVLGHREVYRSGARRALNDLALFWFRLLDPAIRDTICGFRAFRADVLPLLRARSGGFAYEHEVILLAVRSRLTLETVKIRTNPRAGSHVTTKHIIDANNHFDRFVLRELGAFRLPVWRKALLGAGCATGLAAGTVASRVLAARAGRTA